LDSFELVRRAVIVDGMSKRAAAREYGVNRRVVDKMVGNAVPPGYQLSGPRKRPVLGAYMQQIEEILLKEKDAPLKQRHTGEHIFKRLRDEFGYTGGSTQVRGYVSELRARQREAFIPLLSLAGEAQADFGEAWVDMAGVRIRCHAFFMVLPFSDVWFMRIYPAENAESFCEANALAFAFFGGVPRRIVYDNAGYAVKRRHGRLKGRDRELCALFSELRSAFLFEAAFAAPYKGNEKGSVERHVGTLRQALLVPVPQANSFEELNERLLAKALANKEKAEMFQEESSSLLPLADYAPSRLEKRKADKLSLVTFESNSYSVPTQFVLRSVLVRARPFKLEIFSSKELVATHVRSYEKDRAFAQLGHYLDLLEQKPRAVRTALAVLQAGLPDSFEAYRRRVEDGTSVGDRRYIAILRLGQEIGFERVGAVLGQACILGAREPAEIRMLALKETEAPTAILCTDWKLPENRQSPRVKRPPLTEYTRLLAGAAA
jgi:transposase